MDTGSERVAVAAPRMQEPLGPRPHLADASAMRLLQAHTVPRDQRQIKVGSTFAQRNRSNPHVLAVAASR
jgi:hypothetical protein